MREFTPKMTLSFAVAPGGLKGLFGPFLILFASIFALGLTRIAAAEYESYVDLQPGVWTEYRIQVEDRKARLYVHGAEQPCLIVRWSSAWWSPAKT
jgi:hypothetical protein